MGKLINPPEVMHCFSRVVRVGHTGEYYLRVYPGNTSQNRQGDDASYYALSAIFESHSRGTVETDFPDLKEKDLRLCSAFLATNVPSHPAYIKNNRGKRVKILFDENLPYGLVTALTEGLPNLSHVYLEGMEGYMDDYIFYRPQHQIESTASSYQRKKSVETKYIIVSRDTDLSDLARAQWTQRIATCANPEEIDFSDTNVVFRVVDESLTNLENAARFKELGRDIMRAAYSCKAASYAISKSGVYTEKGSSLQELIGQMDRAEMQKRANQGLLSLEERDVGREGRYKGYFRRIQDELALRQRALSLSA